MSQTVWLFRVAVAFGVAAAVVVWVGDREGTLSLNERSVRIPEEDKQTGYPKTWKDGGGYSVTLESPPASVASRALAIDHFMFAVLPESQIAGVSEFAHLPQFSNVHDHVVRLGLPAVRDGEALLMIDPSLLLVSEITSPDFVRLARATHVPVFTMPTMFSGLQDIVRSMRLIGDLSGQPARAAEAISAFESTVDKLARTAPDGKARPRVLALTSYYHCFGNESLVEDIVVLLGADNVCSEFGLGPSDKVDPEQIAGWNPDWIVIGTGGRSKSDALADLAEDPAVALTRAGRSRQFIAIEDRYLLAMSQHILGAMSAVAVGLYPATPADYPPPGDPN